MIPWWWLCAAFPAGFVLGAFWLAWSIRGDNWPDDQQ